MLKITNINFPLILIVIVLLIMVTVISIVKYYKLLKDYDKILNIMKTYEDEIENDRINRHENKNQLITIKSKIIDKQNNNEIIDYIDSLLGESTSFSYENYAKFKYLPQNGLKSLFYLKTMKAKDLNINVDINISKEIINSSLKEFKQLTKLIGIYLDNAIEASHLSSSKKIGIEMYLNYKDIELIISNSYDNRSSNKIGKQPVSVKGKNHGYGLLLAKRIIDSSKIFEEEKTITSKLYIQKLIITNHRKIKK